MRKFSMRRLALFGVASQFALLGAVAAPTSAAAAPVEYVRVCDVFGTGFYYTPGTERCADGNPMGFRTVTEWGVLRNSAGATFGVGGFTGEAAGNSAFGTGAWAGGDPNGDLIMPEPTDPSDPSYTYDDYVDQQIYDALGGIYPRENVEVTLAPPGDPSDPDYDPDYAAYYDSLGGVYTVIGASGVRFPRSNFANMNTTAIGQGAQAGAGALGQDNATAVGQGATANALNATAIGQGAQANADNAVALGRGSIADVADTVSVGQVGGERKIVNVAAGAVTSTSTEAVVGSQLHAASSSVAAALGGGASVDANGVWTAPSYTVQGASHTDVGSALTALDGQVTANTADIGDLQTDVSTNTAAIADLETDVAANTAAIGDLQTDVTDLQSDVSGLQTDVADLQTDVGDLQTDVGALQTDVADLQSDVSDIQDNLSTQGAAISGLEDDVAAHETAIADLETDVDGLQTEVAANTAAIGEIETDVAANTADIDALETAQADTDGRVDDLESGASGVVRTSAGGLTVGAAHGGGAVDFAGTDGDRRLTGVAAGVMGTDVVNVAQMEAAIAAAAETASQGHQFGDAPDGMDGPLAEGSGAYAAGYGSNAQGADTTAVGTGAQATFEGATAIGAGARATADPTTAVGFFAAATGNNASAFGGLAEASGENSTAIGESSVASATGATALGRGAVASAANSVALGAGSTATRGAQANYAALGLADPQTSAGEVSVGTASGARQITNVAAGSAPNDAVNVSQLAGVRAEALAYTDLMSVAFNHGLDRVMQRAEAGTAAALATAGLVQATEPGKSMVTAGVGTWRGESAVAFGLSHRFEGAWTLKAAGAYATEGGLGMNAAVGFEF